MTHYSSTASIYKFYLECSSVSIDTRTMDKGALYVALKGPRFDANQMAGRALEMGAKFVVVDDESVILDDRYLYVKDSLIALQELACFHRANLTIPVLGVTGSNGKTTTKELTKAVLQPSYNIIATRGNYNNHIGVPLTILDTNENTQILIVEMGSNQPGDIAFLCEIADPTMALITNIGLAHLELLNGEEGVYNEKISLFKYVSEKEGILFINEEDKFLETWYKSGFKNEIYSSTRLSGAKLAGGINKKLQLVCKLDEGKNISSFTTHITGLYNLINISAALTVGSFFNIPYEDALRSISEYHPVNHRSQLMKTKRNLLIADAYNANPSSMRASINSFYNDTLGEDTMLILGDMLELGDSSKIHHESLIAYVNDLKLENIFVGTEFMRHSKGSSGYYLTSDELINSQELDKIKDKRILIKGSRGIGLEKIFEYL